MWFEKESPHTLASSPEPLLKGDATHGMRAILKILFGGLMVACLPAAPCIKPAEDENTPAAQSAHPAPVVHPSSPLPEEREERERDEVCCAVSLPCAPLGEVITGLSVALGGGFLILGHFLDGMDQYPRLQQSLYGLGSSLLGVGCFLFFFLCVHWSHSEHPMQQTQEHTAPTTAEHTEHLMR